MDSDMVDLSVQNHSRTWHYISMHEISCI